MRRSPIERKITNTPIVFEEEVLNIGNAMNLTSGKFTAPRAGMYSFSFTGRVYFNSSSLSRLRFGVSIILNGYNTRRGWADDVSDSEEQYDTFSLQSTFKLQAGYQIWLRNELCSLGLERMHDYNDWLRNQFSGWLIEENMSQSSEVPVI